MSAPIKEQLTAGGYVILKKVISQELTDRLLSVPRENLPLQIRDAGAKFAFGEYPVFPQMHEKTWPIAGALQDSGILNSILGETLFLRLPATVRYVPPNTPDALTPPHQDVHYNRDIPEFITVWIPLTPIDKTSGGVALYPTLGHDKEIATTRHDSRGRHIVDVGGAKPVTFEMTPGDALIFGRHVVHATRPNTSDQPRFSIDMRLFRTIASISRLYLDMQTWDIVKLGDSPLCIRPLRSDDSQIAPPRRPPPKCRRQRPVTTSGSRLLL